MRRLLAHPLTKGGLLAITFGFITWSLRGQWQELRASATSIHVAWSWVGAATLVVLGTYAALIHSWRMLLGSLSHQRATRLDFGVAARIWTIANLGRWVPGKVWSVGALGVLAAREGVSGTAAAGAALLGTLLNIGAGFAVTVLTGAAQLDAVRPGLRVATEVAAVLFAVGVLALPRLMPGLLRAVARWRGTPSLTEAATTPLSARTLWSATLINALSWVGYGVAFGLFARGVTPGISSNPGVFIAVFSASYLIGYLALFAPGGIGFREYALVALLVAFGVAGKGDAVILSAASRVWLTVLEVLPGVISLFWLTPSQRAALRQTG